MPPPSELANQIVMRIILPLLLLAFMACKTEYPGQEPEPFDEEAPVPVRTIEISTTTAPIPLEAGGTIAAKEEARLSFKVGGIIERVTPREGQYVRRGQLLAALKTTEIDAQVTKARQARDKAERDLQRVRALYADSAATYEAVQNLETALEVAESDWEIAGFNQQYAKIFAPVSGRIVKRLAEPNELIGPGSPVLFMVAEGQRSYVLRVGIADRDVLSLALGDKAEVSLDAYPSEPVAATVTEIAAAADPLTGTFDVELTLQPGDRPLRLGFVGRAEIYPSRQSPYYRLPLAALVEGEGQLVKVFSLDSTGRAHAHQVRVRRLLDEDFVVDPSELGSIKHIVTDGAAYLTDGAAVVQNQ